jgi:hypothetical protein
MRFAWDLYFEDDPDGLNPGQRRGGRTDHAYVSADFGVARLLIGRLQRNWWRMGSPGLFVSDGATAYPQLALALHFGRFALRALTGELDTILGQKRYLAAHRLDYASENFAVSGGSSVMYASTRGGFQLRYLNPVEFIYFDAENEPDDVTVNVMLDAQFWWRTGSFVLHAEGLLDDIDVDPEGEDRAPARYGFTVGGQWLPRSAPVAVSLEYEQVSAFAYRTNREVDKYTFLERGLGRNYVDYDRLTLAAEFYPRVAGLLMTPMVQVQRQGEGDLRDPFPPYPVFRASPALFLGVRETTYRLGLRARYQPLPFFWLAVDLGENWVRNKDHVERANRSEFQVVAQVGASIEIPLRRWD